MIYSIIESSFEEIRIQKTGHKYILFVDGKQASILYCDDYNQEGFNWALISNVYTEEQYRGHGYSKILNDAILSEAKKRKIKILYLKTELKNYYEKFGAQYMEKLNEKEKIYYFDLK